MPTSPALATTGLLCHHAADTTPLSTGATLRASRYFLYDYFPSTCLQKAIGRSVLRGHGVSWFNLHTLFLNVVGPWCHPPHAHTYIVMPKYLPTRLRTDRMCTLTCMYKSICTWILIYRTCRCACKFINAHAHPLIHTHTNNKHTYMLHTNASPSVHLSIQPFIVMYIYMNIIHTQTYIYGYRSRLSPVGADPAEYIEYVMESTESGWADLALPVLRGF